VQWDKLEDVVWSIKCLSGNIRCDVNILKQKEMLKMKPERDIEKEGEERVFCPPSLVSIL